MNRPCVCLKSLNRSEQFCLCSRRSGPIYVSSVFPASLSSIKKTKTRLTQCCYLSYLHKTLMHGLNVTLGREHSFVCGFVCACEKMEEVAGCVCGWLQQLQANSWSCPRLQDQPGQGRAGWKRPWPLRWSNRLHKDIHLQKQRSHCGSRRKVRKINETDLLSRRSSFPRCLL